MKFTSKLAWRYLRSGHKGLARFTRFIAVTGIAAGVASLIIAMALSRGAQSEIREKILINTAHISTFRTDGQEIPDWEPLAEKMRSLEGVETIEATTYESAVVSGKKDTAYAVLRAVPTGETSVGAELAERIGAAKGDQIDVIVPGQKGFGPVNSQLSVKDSFKTGLYDYDSTWIYVSFEELARLTGRHQHFPTTLNIKVRDIYSAGDTASKISSLLGPEFRVIGWQEANRPLFAALKLEQRVVISIIGLIILVSALSITTTLALMVSERRLDIAVLRTCGIRTRELILLFLFEGAILCLVGVVIGIIFGLLISSAANYFNWIELPAEVYSISSVRLIPKLSEVLLISMSVMLMGVIATLYPAWQASRIKPLENLRHS